MGTTADKLAYLNGTKTAIKNAIVAKGVAVPDGTTFRGYADKIGSIVKVPSLSNAGSASDLRSGKQLAGADGSVITGTLAEVTQATPSISVSSGGLITASVTQSGGIVAAGSKSSTQQLTTQGAKTVTPGTSNQTAVASGRYTTGAVTVKGDANLVPENIAEGVSIFGVQGTLSGGGLEWIKYQAPTFRAPPSATYSQISIPIISNVSTVILYINANIPTDIPYSLVALRPDFVSLESQLVNGATLLGTNYPYAIDSSGSSGTVQVSNNALTFYVVTGAVDYLYYAYIPVFST